MIEIQAITIDAANPYEIAGWWSKAMGVPVEEGAKPEDDEVAVQIERDPYLLFIRVPEGKTVKNRLHLDVRGTEGRTRDEEVERLIGLGATVHADLRRPDGGGWVTMLDPEGNEFCVCRNEAERESQA
jgi:hypothetical protein